MVFKAHGAPIDWAISSVPVAYLDALDAMKRHAHAIRHENARELVWLLEHPPLLTAGTSAKPDDLIDPNRFDVFPAGRGGQYTYHGPGQRVVYLMLDLRARGGDVHGLIENLEAWISRTLSLFNIRGETRKGRVGIWVHRPDKPGGQAEAKIAALGLRVSQGVTTHGVSLNVEPNLEHFQSIVPCGLAEYGVTSLADLGLPVTMADADIALRASFQALFGPVRSVPPPV